MEAAGARARHEGPHMSPASKSMVQEARSERKAQERVAGEASWETVKKKESKPKPKPATRPPFPRSNQYIRGVVAKRVAPPVPAIMGLLANQPNMGGFLVGLPGVPREICFWIFEYLQRDRSTLVRMRRVCRAWQTWLTSLPVHIIWPAVKFHVAVSVSMPTLSIVTRAFGGLTGLSLSSYALAPGDVITLGLMLGSCLRHLQFELLETLQPPQTYDRMGAFTALESLSITNIGTLSVLFRSLFEKFGVYSYLHTLELGGVHQWGSKPFTISSTTRFPALTSLSLGHSIGLISHPGVYSQLRKLSRTFVGSSSSTPSEDEMHALLAPNLQELSLCYLWSSPDLSTDIVKVTALTLLGGNISLQFIGRFPNLRYLDISLASNPMGFRVKDLPKLSELSILRSIGAPFEWFINGIENYPSLQRIIANKHQFTPPVRQQLEQHGVEASEYQPPHMTGPRLGNFTTHL